MNLLSVSNITAGYGRHEVLSGVSFELEAGCMMGMIGANGSGKTTLLKALCGILPHEGSCRMEGVRLDALSSRQRARLCSYIPQRSGVTIDISVLDVVLMGFNPHLGLLEHPTAAMREQAMQTLAMVGLAGKEHLNYLHLSEGQKQLCILARTLAGGSRLLLLDEPESSLDFRFRSRMLSLLHRWVREKQRGVIVALHDPTLALNCCDRLLVLINGSVHSILHPRSDPTDLMEETLSRIYGAVSLHHIRDRSGSEQLVMVKEEDT